MFRIETKNNKNYVIPTSNYVLEHFDKKSFPYDSNWEIFCLFNFPPEDFFKYIISVYEARVEFKKDFPWVSFYFPSYIKAEQFKKEVEERAQKP